MIITEQDRAQTVLVDRGDEISDGAAAKGVDDLPSLPLRWHYRAAVIGV